MTGDLARRVLDGDPELARIADAADDALLDEIFELMITEVTDPAGIARAAAAVERFAALLPPGRRDPLAAEASLWLASVAVDDGRFDESGRRARAVRDRLDPEIEPGRVAWAENILGGIAQEEDRVADAVAHWDRAADLADADDDPSSAAMASASAASLLRTEGVLPAGQMRDRWAAAFEFYTQAGEADDARIAGTNASVYAITALKAVPTGAWQPRRLLDEALAARAFAERAGADHEAAHLVFLVVVALADLGAPMDEIRSWTATARAAYDALDHDPAEVAVWRATIDFAEGNAAIQAGDTVSAEPPLRSALAVFEPAGETERAAAVRRQLLAVVYSGEKDGDDRAAEILRGLPGADADEAAMAAYVAETAARDTAPAAEVDRLHRRTRQLLLEAGEPIKACGMDVEHAVWGLRQGSPVAVRAALAAARVQLADPPPGTSLAALRWLSLMAVTGRAALAGHVGDREGQLAELEVLEIEQLAAGSGLLAARTAVQRAGLMLAAGRSDQAYATALPAALALDAVRFTFTDAGRRRRWAGIAAEGFAVACRAAAALGYVRELGELIEVLRGASLPDPSDEPADSLDRMLAQAGHELLAGRPDERGPGRASAGSVSGAVPGAAALADAGRTALGLPARLRTPWGSTALEGPLQRARTYLDPVRAEEVVTWSVPALSEARSAGSRG